MTNTVAIPLDIPDVKVFDVELIGDQIQCRECVKRVWSNRYLLAAGDHYDVLKIPADNEIAFYDTGNGDMQSIVCGFFSDNTCAWRLRLNRLQRTYGSFSPNMQNLRNWRCA